MQHHQPEHKFWDDCGAWTCSHGRKVTYDSNLKELPQLPSGLYGYRKRSGIKRILVELEPQPTDVLEVHQLCSKLKREPSFNCRITYLGNSDCFLAEYLGTFPDEVEPHGNSAKNATEYVHCKPVVLENIFAAVKKAAARPQKVYQELLKTAAQSDEQCPRNKKQVKV